MFFGPSAGDGGLEFGFAWDVGAICDKDGGGTGAAGEGGERFAVVCRSGICQESGDGTLVDFSGTLAADDHAGTDVAKFDGGGDVEDAIECAQAGIGDIADDCFA